MMSLSVDDGCACAYDGIGFEVVCAKTAVYTLVVGFLFEVDPDFCEDQSVDARTEFGG